MAVPSIVRNMKVFLALGTVTCPKAAGVTATRNLRRPVTSRNVETCLKLKQAAETGSDLTSKKARKTLEES